MATNILLYATGVHHPTDDIGARMSDPIGIHVLHWRYHDRSGGGLIRAYTTLFDARRDLAMMIDYGDPGKEYLLETVPEAS